jgi:hypothetical protein
MIVCAGESVITDHITAAMPESPSVKRLVSVGPEVPEGFEDFHKGIEAAAPFVKPEHPNTNDDISLMYFTSGTTGEPKMVAHDFTYPLGHIVTGSFWHNLKESSLHLTIADTGWGKAVWGKLYGQWIAGANVFVYDHEKFTPAEVAGEFDARTDKPLLRISRRHHGNIKSSVLTQDFVHGADYAALAEAAETFRGLLSEGAKAMRGEGDKQKEEKVSDFRQAMKWLISEAERTTARQRYKGLGEMNPEQLWETTMDPNVRRLLRVQIDDAIEADRVFTMLMGDEVEPRRDFIETNALRAGNIDV